MKFYEEEEEEIDQIMQNRMIEEDSEDELECFGEFNQKDIICTKYCSASIRCAIEHNSNSKIDIFEHLLNLNFFQTRMQ